jgi:hypothetical protein
MHLNGKRYAARLQAHLEPGEEVRGRFPVMRDASVELSMVPNGDVVATDRATLLWDTRLRLLLAGPLQSFPLDHTKRVSHLDLVGSEGECVGRETGVASGDFRPNYHAGGLPIA